jgi:enamine deaminase RidA (YjgF/YER057c/UK114 family)
MSFERKSIRSKSSKAMPGVSFSPAIRAGDLLFISAQDACQANGEVLHPGDAIGQSRVAFQRIGEILEAAGGTFNDVVDVLAVFLDVRDAENTLEVAREFLRKDFPAWTFMGTQGFQRPGVLVQVHAVAHLGKEKKKCITPESLRYWKQYPMSSGCRKGPYLFVSGQMSIDVDGEVQNPGDHRAQARYLFHRIEEVVESAGGKLQDDVLDLLSFSIDPRSFNPMCTDVGCQEFLTMPLSQAPSWSVIGSTGLFKHLAFHSVRAICEIGNGKAVAYTPSSIFWRYLPVSGGTKKEQGHLLCVAGEVSMDMDGQIVSPGNPEAQARYAFNRIKEVVEMAGGTMDNIVDLISFHKDPRAIETVMAVSTEFFKGAPPAWTAVGYPGGYFEGHLHEICARAWLP